MKIKLKWFALMMFALAASLRLQAQDEADNFAIIEQCGAPGDFSGPVGPPAKFPQFGTKDLSFGIAEATGDAGDYFGGIKVFDSSGNGNFTPSTLFTFGIPGTGFFPETGLAIGCVTGDGIRNFILGTESGGDNNAGTVQVFSMTSGGIIPLPTISLASTNGTDPSAVTVGPDGSFFVALETGGPGLHGSVAKITLTPAEQAEIEYMNYLNGNIEPMGSFAISIGGGASQSVSNGGVNADGIKANVDTPTNYTLYGVTFFGGTNANGTSGYGTVYKFNSDLSGFQTLRVFSFQQASNGYGPGGGMALSGNTLYGTTSGGGPNGSGEVFKMDTSGSNFMVLKSFAADGSEGEAPEGDLLLSGNTLYGTTLEGGTNGGGGVVYSINTGGSNFTVLHSFSNPTDNGTGVFTNSDGGGTRAGLLLSRNVLYGTTPYGGTYGGGTVFAITLPSPPRLKIAPSGGSFTVSWRSSATNFMLQENLTLNSLTWSNFTGAVNDNGTNKSVSIIPTAGEAFFRLMNTNSP